MEVLATALANAFASVSGGEAQAGGETQASTEVLPGTVDAESDSGTAVDGKSIIFCTLKILS